VIKSSRLSVNFKVIAAPFLCVLFVIFVSACGGKSNVRHDGDQSSASQPGWVLNTPVEKGFLYGVGSAEVFGGDQSAAVARAKDMARVELVKQITVDVSGVVEQEISETLKGGVSSLTEKLRQQVKSQVPEFKLTNVSQVDSYQADRHVSALVRLDVAKELRILRDQISDLDSQISEYEELFNTNPKAGINAVRQVAPVLILVDQRGELQARYNALSGSSGSRALLPTEIRDFVGRIYARIGQLRVTIVAEGRSDSSMQTSLISNLTEKGLRISTGGVSDVTITYDLTTNVVRRNGSRYALTSGNIKIIDETGKVINAFQAKAKGVSVDAKEAKARSIIKLASRLSEEMMRALFE